MFCKNCGNVLSDGMQFCNQCGTPVQEPEAPAYTAPVYEAPVYEAPEPVKHVASERKILGWIAWGLTAIVVLVMVLSYFTAINTSLEKTPVMSLLLDESDVKSFEAMKDDVKDNVDHAREMMDELDALSKSDEQILEGVLETLEATAECASLNNLKAVVDSALTLQKVAVEDENGAIIELLEGAVDDAGKEVSDILSMLMNVILYSMLFALAFSLLGGLLRLRGLVISGLVFSALYALIFCGTLFVILSIVLNLALAIVCGKYRKA